MKTRIVQDEPAPAPEHRPNLVQRHPLVTFFVLAFAISWCLLPFGTFLPPGPLVAALVVISATQGVAGLKRLGSRLIRWRVGWRWYAAAVGVPIAMAFTSIGANMGLGAPSPSWDQYSAWYSVFMVFGLNMVMPLFGPLGEEPGFRGFALPALQSRRSPLMASAILAALVVAWHVPLVLIPSFDLAPIELVATVAVTFWYTWLFNHTGGSILLTLVAHSAEGVVNTHDLWPNGVSETREAWMYALAWSVMAIGLVVFDRKAWIAAPRSATDLTVAETETSGYRPSHGVRG